MRALSLRLAAILREEQPAARRAERGAPAAAIPAVVVSVPRRGLRLSLLRMAAEPRRPAAAPDLYPPVSRGFKLPEAPRPRALLSLGSARTEFSYLRRACPLRRSYKADAFTPRLTVPSIPVSRSPTPTARARSFHSSSQTRTARISERIRQRSRQTTRLRPFSIKLHLMADQP